MVPNIEKVIGNFILAESPHWDQDTQSLYFVDTNDKSVHRYIPSTNSHIKLHLGKQKRKKQLKYILQFYY